MTNINPRLMTHDFNPDKLDPGIRQAVLKFRELGYETMTSCESGAGHAFKIPTVGIILKHQDVPLLEQVIPDGVDVSLRTAGNNQAWKQQYASHTNGEYVLVQGFPLLQFK